METKFVIVLLACLSCLVPPALSGAIYVEPPGHVDLHVGLGAVAGAAIKGVAALGAKAVLTGAAVLAAKGLAAKALLAKGAIAGAGAALAASHIGHHIHEHIPETSVVIHPPKAPTILDHIAELIKTAHVSKTSVVHSHGYYRRPVFPVHTHVVHPVVHTLAQPAPQPVAIVGPTMTVHEHSVGADWC